MIVDGYRVHLEKVDFKDSGIAVVGISADPVPAIKDFATKHNVTVCALYHPPSTLVQRSCPDSNK